MSTTVAVTPASAALMADAIPWRVLFDASIVTALVVVPTVIWSRPVP